MTIPENISICEFTKKHIDETKGMSISKFAEQIGFERSSVSKYLNGKYAGASNMEDAIVKYFNTLENDKADSNQSEAALAPASSIPASEIPAEPSRQTTRPTEQQPKNSTPVKNGTIPLFFKSFDARQETAICHACKEYRDTGIIVGKSGYGKSYVLRRYSKKTPNVHYIECGESMTARDFIDALETSIGIPKTGGSDSKRIKNIAAYLNSNPGHLIIIDEADKLMDDKPTSRYSIKKMETLRQLYDLLLVESNESDDTVVAFMNKDEHSTGLILAGEPALQERLKYYLPRFASRAGNLFYELSGLSKNEVKDYLSDFDFTPEALDTISQRGSRTSFRILDQTLKNLFRNLQPVNAITQEDVEKAGAMMMM